MQNKPKLRFKEFNDEWQELKLGDICDIIGGGTPDTTVNEYWGNDINWFTPTEITKKYAGESNRKISKLGLQKSSAKLLPKGTILLTTRATLGEMSILQNEATTNQGFQSLVPKNSTTTEFIYYCQPEIKRMCYKLASGSTFLEISKNTLSKVKLQIPDIKEQSKIAEFLSKVDEVISEREEEVKDLEQQKKGLMQKIFSQQLRFTDSNNNPYPDWEDKKIGDVFEFYNGKAHEQEIDENGEYIVVNSKFISTEGQVKKYTNKVICPLKKDDIVLVMSDVPNGKAMSKCYLIEEDNKYSLNQRICCLRTKDVARFFIYQISRNKYFLKFDNGVSQTNLRKEDVLKCPIQVPCLEEQQKIANVLSKLDELIEEKKALLSDWQQFKKGLLQQMFV